MLKLLVNLFELLVVENRLMKRSFFLYPLTSSVSCSEFSVIVVLSSGSEVFLFQVSSEFLLALLFHSMLHH